MTEDCLPANHSDWIQRIKKLSFHEFIGIFGLVILLVAVFVFIASSQNSPDIEILTEEEVDIESNTKNIFVDVSGAVERPGLYSLGSGSRINDALVAAGGLASFADRQWVAQNINLAALAKDGQKIFIPEGRDQQNNDQLTISNEQLATAKINVNSASQAELEKLSGIGPSLALKIIDYRNQNGPFQSEEDLLKVSGIGEKVLSQIIGKITFW